MVLHEAFSFTSSTACRIYCTLILMKSSYVEKIRFNKVNLDLFIDHIKSFNQFLIFDDDHAKGAMCVEGLKCKFEESVNQRTLFADKIILKDENNKCVCLSEKIKSYYS